MTSNGALRGIRDAGARREINASWRIEEDFGEIAMQLIVDGREIRVTRHASGKAPRLWSVIWSAIELSASTSREPS